MPEPVAVAEPMPELAAELAVAVAVVAVAVAVVAVAVAEPEAKLQHFSSSPQPFSRL